MAPKHSQALLWSFFLCVTILLLHGTNLYRLPAAKFAKLHKVNSHSARDLQENVAICLVGGIRAFELTGPSISKYVLNSDYKDADVFLHAPLDTDSFKLFLLNSSLKFASAKIFKQQLFEEEYHTQVLTPGCQPLLQYFDLVEGCIKLIEDYEKQHNLKYDWIVRTRLDGYWNSWLPPIKSFNPSSYTVPYGSTYTGLNDRLGVGNRNASFAALRRLSMLRDMHRKGYRGLNSEAALKAQLDITNTSSAFARFPFCVLTAKRFVWPLRKDDHVVMALTSKGPLNGAYCRPCVPALIGKEATDASESLDKNWSWIGPNDGVEICDNREDDLEFGLDMIAKEDARASRLQVANLGRDECVLKMENFKKMWESWDGPEPEFICSEKFGKVAS